MLSELPKLFDRNFAVGFVLPAVLLLVGSYLVLLVFQLRPDWMIFHEVQITEAIVVLGVVWVTAIALLAINRPYIRFLEGYGEKYNPLHWVLDKRAKRQFDEHVMPALEAQNGIDAARKTGQTEPRLPHHPKNLRHAVESYPDQKEWVLPTAFGNRYRAIEVYSRVVYGIEAVVAWGRLEPLMPKNFRDSLAEARAQLNFAVNLMLVSFLVLVLYVTVAIAQRSLPAIWLPIAVTAITVIAYFTALSSLTLYGTYVKSAFDLFRADLAKHMGLRMPSSSSDEREMWIEVSRMMTYRSAPAWERLEKYRNN